MDITFANLAETATRLRNAAREGHPVIDDKFTYADDEGTLFIHVPVEHADLLPEYVGITTADADAPSHITEISIGVCGHVHEISNDEGYTYGVPDWDGSIDVHDAEGNSVDTLLQDDERYAAALGALIVAAVARELEAGAQSE